MEKRKHQYELRDFSNLPTSSGRRGGRSTGANTVRYTGADARLLSSPPSPLVEQNYLFAPPPQPPKAAPPTQPRLQTQTQPPSPTQTTPATGGGGGGGSGWTYALLAALTVVLLASMVGGVIYLSYAAAAYVTENDCIDSLKSERRHFLNTIVPEIDAVCPPPADNPYYYWDEECQKPHVLNFLINGWSAHNQ